MTDEKRPTLRFSDVAFAIEATPKTLRNWLQRDQVTLFSDSGGTGWREFSYPDVALLAVVRRLVRYGMKVEIADALAHKIVVEMPGEKWMEMKGGRLASRFWQNRRVALWPTGEDDDSAGWQLKIRDGWKRHNRDPDLDFLTMAPGAVIDRAFKRAETGTEVDDDPDALWTTQQFENPEAVLRERQAQADGVGD